MRANHASCLVPLALAIGCAPSRGCGENKRKEPATHPGFTTAGVNAAKPITERTSTFVKDATAEATRVDKALPAKTPPESYLKLRRAVAAIAPFLRPRASSGSVLLLGDGEEPGALLQLDWALTQGEVKPAKKGIAKVIHSLRKIDHELTLTPLSPEAALQSLSSAAYHVGLLLAGADPQAPSSTRAAMADLRGSLDGMAAITRAMMRRVAGTPVSKKAQAPSASLLARIEALQDRLEGPRPPVRRAELIEDSGALGVASRQFASALGVEVSPPYRALRPRAEGIGEPIHALTLPEGMKDIATEETPLDRFARGDGDLPDAVHEGFDLFVGKGHCSSCHAPPLFGGARAPTFDLPLQAELEVPATPKEKVKTSKKLVVPSLRQIGHTAPYFHHGGFPSLGEVIAFYREEPEIELTDDEAETLLKFLTDGLTAPPED